MLTLWLAVASAAAFTLDRVKLTQAHHDPADVQAQPARYAFLRANDRPIRFAAMATILASVALAPAPIAMAILVLTVLVVAYAAPTPKRRRIKDVLLIKNLSVGIGIAATAAIAVGTLSLAPLAALLVIATADAILCDLDDIEADRAAGTATIPARFGRAQALTLASLLHIAAVALLIVPIEVLALDQALPVPRAASIGLALVAPALICHALRVSTRDVIDARLLLVALLLP